jgi:AraC family transcriptional activator FtrA
MTGFVNITPMNKNFNRNKRHRVVTLAYDNLCLFEFGIASEIFGLARPELEIPWYDFKVCSAHGYPLAALGGIQIQVAGSLKLLDTADTIVIPGWTTDDTPPALLTKLRRANDRGARFVSICSGAKLLGAAGLLDGRRATSHWRYVDALQASFPRAEVVPDVLYVEDGNILTSAGSAAGIDLCLHIVRKDHGSAIANNVARRLVLPAHRSGGQSQFIAKPVARDRHSLSQLMDWVLENLNQAHTVPSLARKANCSERSLLRRFKSATGQSPIQWITEQRVDRAKELLETTGNPLMEIVDLSGFNSAETLRHHFRSLVGVSPSEYRKSFKFED